MLKMIIYGIVLSTERDGNLDLLFLGEAIGLQSLNKCKACAISQRRPPASASMLTVAI